MNTGPAWYAPPAEAIALELPESAADIAATALGYAHRAPGLALGAWPEPDMPGGAGACWFDGYVMAPACPDALRLLVTAPTITAQLERHGLGAGALGDWNNSTRSPVLWFKLAPEPARSRAMVAPLLSVFLWFSERSIPWPAALADIAELFHQGPVGGAQIILQPELVLRVTHALLPDRERQAAALVQLRAMLAPRGAPQAYH
jgi:hypothetical protein